MIKRFSWFLTRKLYTFSKANPNFKLLRVTLEKNNLEEIISALKENGYSSYPEYNDKKPGFADEVEKEIIRCAQKDLPKAQFEKDYFQLRFNELGESVGFINSNNQVLPIPVKDVKSKKLNFRFFGKTIQLGSSVTCEFPTDYSLGVGINYIINWHTHPGTPKDQPITLADALTYAEFGKRINDLGAKNKKKVRFVPVIYYPYTNEAQWYKMKGLV